MYIQFCFLNCIRDNFSNSVQSRLTCFLYSAREAFASLMADHAKQLMQNNQGHLPFHLRMIECLLDETCSFFHQKVERYLLYFS